MLELITHDFLSQKFGEIEELRDQDATSVVMTFKTRSEAENVIFPLYLIYLCVLALGRISLICVTLS